MDNELMLKEDLSSLGFNEAPIEAPVTTELLGGSEVVKIPTPIVVSKVDEQEEGLKERTGFVAGKHMKNKKIWWFQDLW